MNLTRLPGERIAINTPSGDVITVEYVSGRGRVVVKIDAPGNYAIVRDNMGGLPSLNSTVMKVYRCSPEEAGDIIMEMRNGIQGGCSKRDVLLDFGLPLELEQVL